MFFVQRLANQTAVRPSYHKDSNQQEGTRLCPGNIFETMRLVECPVRSALGVIGGKWKPIIAFYLLEGTKRFGQLRKLMPEATQKVITQQLREMERDGIVERKVFAQIPPRVEYSLTPYGRTLRPVMKHLCEWGKRHAERSRKVDGSAKEQPV